MIFARNSGDEIIDEKFIEYIRPASFTRGINLNMRNEIIAIKMILVNLNPSIPYKFTKKIVHIYQTCGSAPNSRWRPLCKNGVQLFEQKCIIYDIFRPRVVRIEWYCHRLSLHVQTSTPVYTPPLLRLPDHSSI